MSLLELFSRSAVFHNDEITLRLSDYDLYDEETGIDDGFLFHIYRRHSLKKSAISAFAWGKARGCTTWAISVTASTLPTAATAMPCRPAG